jgi:hypothetical protein
MYNSKFVFNITAYSKNKFLCKFKHRFIVKSKFKNRFIVVRSVYNATKRFGTGVINMLFFF